jgi:hypothetical protein
MTLALVAPSAPPDLADLDGDGSVGPADLAALLALFGPATPGGPGDIDGSGNVDALDLATLLSRWTG